MSDISWDLHYMMGNTVSDHDMSISIYLMAEMVLGTLLEHEWAFYEAHLAICTNQMWLCRVSPSSDLLLCVSLGSVVLSVPPSFAHRGMYHNILSCSYNLQPNGRNVWDSHCLCGAGDHLLRLCSYPVTGCPGPERSRQNTNYY